MEKTVKEIFERDRGRCVRCGSYRNLESIPHHVIFRSSLGKGTKVNGVTICRDCHDWAHESKKQNNIWFVEWVEEYLDEDGEYKKQSPFTYEWHD